MNGPERLAAIVTALERLGVPYLVMGGHAVRYYGVDRNTIDYDLHISIDDWERLPERLAQVPLFAGANLVEGPSWRAGVFRRFQIGRLDDGREEWLEFWRANHLLAPFDQLAARSESGDYAGRSIRFLGLSDLIRSKETERSSDWQDVALLEEIRDLRNAARAVTSGDQLAALSELRSRRGFEDWFAGERCLDSTLVGQALSSTDNPITAAFLRPFAPDATPPDFGGMIAEILAGPLRSVSALSAKHLALVEAVRRLYKQHAIDTDRADKVAAQQNHRNANHPQ